MPGEKMRTKCVQKEYIVEKYNLIGFLERGVLVTVVRPMTALQIAAEYVGKKKGNGLAAVQSALGELVESGFVKLDGNLYSQTVIKAESKLKPNPIEIEEPVEPDEKISYSDGLLIITEEAMTELTARFPAVNLNLEINKIEDWLGEHPKRKHKSLWLFVLNWIRRVTPTVAVDNTQAIRDAAWAASDVEARANYMRNRVRIEQLRAHAEAERAAREAPTIACEGIIATSTSSMPL